MIWKSDQAASPPFVHLTCRHRDRHSTILRRLFHPRPPNQIGYVTFIQSKYICMPLLTLFLNLLGTILSSAFRTLREALGSSPLASCSSTISNSSLTTPPPPSSSSTAPPLPTSRSLPSFALSSGRGSSVLLCLPFLFRPPPNPQIFSFTRDPV